MSKEINEYPIQKVIPKQYIEIWVNEPLVKELEDGSQYKTEHTFAYLYTIEGVFVTKFQAGRV